MKKGRLRIYLGYAAGVGKTYRMLEDARNLKDSGTDVVLGYIEPHNRQDTSGKTETFEKIPVLRLNYRGREFPEFNLDLALERKPSLILVDELAHTNITGARHKKRYQDIEELLDNGIDVFTTVNVQHIESLFNVVEQITGVVVNERIPDSVFDNADQVEVIDIHTEDLLQRLKEGKIYQGLNRERAAENFFTPDKLTALRELALRKVAEQVNRNALKEDRKRRESPPTGSEHVLVCLSSSKTNARVIRSAARMAEAFSANFTALFVETSDSPELKDDRRKFLSENLHLAEGLGAQIATVYGDDIAVQIAQYARLVRASKIVMGRSSVSTFFWRRKLVDRLTELTPNMDIYIIPDRPNASERKMRPGRKKDGGITFSDTLKSVLILTMCTLISLFFDSRNFSIANIIIIYILGVQLNAFITHSRIYNIISSVLSVLVFNYFFTDPRYSLMAFDPGYPLTFVVMFTAAFITSSLIKKVKLHAKNASDKSIRTEIFLETSMKLQSAKDESDILDVTAEQLVKLLKKNIAVFRGGENPTKSYTLYKYDGPAQSDEIKENSEKNTVVKVTRSNSDVDYEDTGDFIDQNEIGIASWVMKNGRMAGRTTDTLSEARGMYLAVRSHGKVHAVIGTDMRDSANLDSSERGILLTILYECGLAMEREYLTRKQINQESEIEREKLRSNLLRAISHDLRTPLTSISGNAGILISDGEGLNEDKKKLLYTEIQNDSQWLVKLVENLLSITRIDSGVTDLRKNKEVLEDIIIEAVKYIRKNNALRKITTDFTDEILQVEVDYQLIYQVMMNLLDNAVKYTEDKDSVDIYIGRKGQDAVVEVRDTGKGIKDEDKDRIFNLFYVGGNERSDGRRGMGIGLSLVKSVISLHGGKTFIRDNRPKGTVTGFTLPLAEGEGNEENKYSDS